MVKDDRVCSAARRDSNKLLACGLLHGEPRCEAANIPTLSNKADGNTQTVSFRTIGMNALYISLGEY